MAKKSKTHVARIVAPGPVLVAEIAATKTKKGLKFDWSIFRGPVPEGSWYTTALKDSPVLDKDQDDDGHYHTYGVERRVGPTSTNAWCTHPGCNSISIVGWTIPTDVDDFERRYAERSGVSVEWLHQHGRRGAPCDCGDAICEGWQMLHDALLDHGPDRSSSGE